MYYFICMTLKHDLISVLTAYLLKNDTTFLVFQKCYCFISKIQRAGFCLTTSVSVGGNPQSIPTKRSSNIAYPCINQLESSMTIE